MNPLGFSARRVVTAGILLLASFNGASAARSNGLEIHQTSAPRFPDALVSQNITAGEAWVMITVDENGELSDALPTRYTHRALADEAVYALRQWRYTAPRVDGRPVGVRTEVYFTFEATGAVISLDPNGTLRSLASFANRPTYVDKLCPAAELDGVPTPVYTVSPPVPAAANADQTRTLIDFIIDEHGRARMPVLIGTQHTQFAEHAANALAQWKFTPPTRRGEPVAVRVRQEFFVPAGS